MMFVPCFISLTLDDGLHFVSHRSKVPNLEDQFLKIPQVGQLMFHPKLSNDSDPVISILEAFALPSRQTGRGPKDGGRPSDSRGP